MSQPQASSTPPLDECGCCEGVEQLTPTSIVNPPGLSSLDYRVGTYSRFRESMIASIPQFPALSGLRTRFDSDLSIALFDAWATVGDVLTFYQERIANEGFLNTAVERRSVLELARAVGYELRPGVAASTYLAFTLEDSAGAITESTIGVGTKVQSLPIQGQNPPETPQTFETIESIDAYPDLNSVAPLSTIPQFTAETDLDSLTSITLVGTNTRLQTGDRLMLANVQSDGTVVPFAFKTISAVNIDASSQQTIVNLVVVGIQFSFPSSVAVDSSGNLYVADTNNNRVQKFDGSGNFLLTWVSRGSSVNPPGPGEFGDPGGVAVDSSGNVYVIDNQYTRIVKFDGSGNYLLALSFTAAQAEDFGLSGVAVDSSGNIFVADNNNGVIWKFDSQGNGPTPIQASQLSGPFDVAVNPAGNLYVANQASNCVVKLDSSGNYSSTMGAGQLNGPVGVALDSSGNVYVADQGNGRVVKFDTAGNIVLVFGSSGSGNGQFSTLQSVAVDSNGNVFATDVGRNCVTKFDAAGDFLLSWGTSGSGTDHFDDPSTPMLRASTAILNQSTPYYTGQTQSTGNMVSYANEVMSPGIDYSQVTAAVLQKGWSIGDFSNIINLLGINLQPTEAVKVYAFRAKAGIFGSNAQPYNTLPFPLQFTTYTKPWDSLPINTNSQGEFYDDGSVIYLDNAYSVSSGSTDSPSWAVLTGKDNQGNLHTSAFTISDVTEETMSDFMITSKSTGLTLDAPSDKLSIFTLRKTMAYLQSEELTPAALTDTTPVQGSSITLDSYVNTLLNIGQTIAISGQIQSSTQDNENQSNINASEIAFITNITATQNTAGALVTSIEFSPTLSNVYIRSTVTINANVALATHGETKNEVLGSGDPSQPYLEFSLKQNPLTYIPAANPSGAETTLSVWVDNILWNEVDSLYGVGPKDHSYITRIDDTGQVNIIFGNSRPAAGSENITAQYRVGIGQAGMLAPGQLSILMTRPLGVNSVTNPIAPTGAADPEQIDSARQNAPVRVLTLDRIVSLEDFANFAISFAGIAKALAISQSEGTKNVVHLIVGAAMGPPYTVDPTSDLYSSLVSAIQTYADPMIPFVVDIFTLKLFNISGWIIVDQDYVPDIVQQAVVQALTNEFSYQSMQFGQPVTRSKIIQTMQEVDGVVAADIDTLYLTTGNETLNQILPADVSDLLLLNSTDPQGLQIQVKTP